jgi:type IV pilus assembly protein PilO
MDYKEKIDDFLDLPWYYRLGAGALVLCIIASSYYYFFLFTMYDEISELKRRSGDLQKEIQLLKIKASQLPQFQADVERLDMELTKALRELPDKREIDTLLARISEKAKDAGLDVVLFKPELEQKKDFYAEVPVSLEVLGGFHQVASFFDEVAHMERIVNMSQFRLETGSKDSWEILKISAIATSFRFLDESERLRVDDKENKKRRKK